jgi:hypothetical protein
VSNEPYWQGVKARVLPALFVGLVTAAAVWVADDSIGKVALAVILLVGFLSAALLPSRPARRDRR